MISGKNVKRKFLLLLVGIIAIVTAQNQTMGLFLNSAEVAPGYTLFAPQQYSKTYLIDKFGHRVHSWSSNFVPGLSVYLLENGNLLHTARVNNQIFQTGGRGGSGISPGICLVW